MGSKQNLSWDQLDTSQLSLEKLIIHFEVNNRSEGKSPRTVAWYNEVLRLFLRWLRAQGHPDTLGEVDRDIARDFVLNLQARRGRSGHPSTHTINNRVRALRAFFNWLYRVSTS